MITEIQELTGLKTPHTKESVSLRPLIDALHFNLDEASALIKERQPPKDDETSNSPKFTTILPAKADYWRRQGKVMAHAFGDAEVRAIGALNLYGEPYNPGAEPYSTQYRDSGSFLCFHVP